MSKIVLCVDDSVTMQQVADITFRGTAFQYVGARTVDEALGKVKGQKPAVVLADAAMPGKNGYDLCMALKSDPGTADVPVVILVGNSAPYDNAKGTQVGADANLPKPWDTQTMLEKVTEIANKGAQAKPGAAGAVAAPAKAPQAAAAATPAAAPVAAAAASAKEAPRSATIMGMPTIKMPAGVAPTVTAAAPGGEKKSAAAPSAAQTAAPPGAAPDNPATVIGAAASLRPPAGKAGVAQPVATPAKGSPATSPAATAAPAAAAAPTTSASQAAAPAKAASAPAAASSSNGGISGMNRSPMVSGIPTKRSVLVERTLAKMAARLAELSGIEPGSPELIALLKLSTEVVERVVWEVVPELAEHIIRENLPELSKRS